MHVLFIKLFILTTVTLFIPNIFHAQTTFFEGFEDGEFTNNPEWTGNTADFEVINQVLRLNDTDNSAGGIAYLSTEVPSTSNNMTTYEAWITQEFSSSGSNYSKWYLASSESNLNTDLNGYFIAVGGISGSDDALRFFRQDGDDEVLLATGTAGLAAADPTQVFIRVLRDTDGNWEIFGDFGSGIQLEATASDNTYPINQHMGFQCIYSSTRFDKFAFDSIKVDPIYEDLDAPVLDSIYVFSNNKIVLYFNEPINTNSISSSSFSISPSISILSTNTVSNKIIELELGNDLVIDEQYMLSLNGIEDLNGNRNNTQVFSFQARIQGTASYASIMISEVFPDPAPSIGLPEVEFIELFNNSNTYINLGDLKLLVNNSERTLPNLLLAPKSYIVVTDDGNSALFDQNITTVEIDLPGLTNSGASVSLVNDNNGALIDYIEYSLASYGSLSKIAGGYTLERINLNLPCLKQENWLAADNLIGGTPGYENSVKDDDFGTDLTFGVSEITLDSIANNEISIVFNQNIDPSSNFATNLYSITGTPTVMDVFDESEGNDQLTLFVDPTFEVGVPYYLTFEDELTDCQGNTFLIQDNFLVGNPFHPSEGSLIINEILFNPVSGGADFIEIYNTSDKMIDAGQLIIGNIQPGIDTSLAAPEGIHLFPAESYLVFTTAPFTLSEYANVDYSKVVTSDMPSFSDSEGNCTIYTVVNNEPLVFDELNYLDDWHHPLLADKNGVSLERVSISGRTQDSLNWESAGADVNYGTPTQANSQELPVGSNSEKYFSFLNTRLSPNQDNFEDELLIEYNFPEGEWLVNAKVFDAAGREETKFISNYLVSNSGFLRWDGTNNQQEALIPNLYLVFLEAISTSGETYTTKKTVVLTP